MLESRLAPLITSYAPTGTNVPITAAIVVTFSEEVTNITNQTFFVDWILADNIGGTIEERVQGTLTYDPSEGARFVPLQPLVPGEVYQVAIDNAKITDLAGNRLAEEYPGWYYDFGFQTVP